MGTCSTKYEFCVEVNRLFNEYHLFWKNYQLTCKLTIIWTDKHNVTHTANSLSELEQQLIALKEGGN